MDHPWSVAAAALKAERIRSEQAAIAADPVLALKQAIEQAQPLLEAFLEEHGEAAQGLLKELNIRESRESGQNTDHPFIVFGERPFDSTQLYRRSVVFCTKGLRLLTIREHDSDTTFRPTTASEAVEYFSQYGAGSNDPEKVLNIATWLEDQINQLIPK